MTTRIRNFIIVRTIPWRTQREKDQIGAACVRYPLLETRGNQNDVTDFNGFRGLPSQFDVTRASQYDVSFNRIPDSM